MKKTSEKITVILFIVLIFGIAICHFVMVDNETSKSERRKLAQFPEFNIETLMDKSFFEDFETYLQDQFPIREKFRQLKSIVKFDILRQQDNNQIYFVEDGIYKWENQNKPKEVDYFIKKINSLISENFVKNAEKGHVFYSIIPDKNYFVAEKNGFPHLDYKNLINNVTSGIDGGKYIDIIETLRIDDYYRTDAHWNQQYLQKTVEKLASGMGTLNKLPQWSSYKKRILMPFYGVYSGQAAMGDLNEPLTYLTNSIIENATVKSVEVRGEMPVYKEANFQNLDGYDVFLNGAQALLEINNPLGEKERELVIFRDSFGSSITPLLIAPYSKIWVVDLRYMASSFLPNLVKINENQDVLFLYSTSLINSGMLLK